MLLRKPLLLLFVLGCGVSAMASGRFSARLIADGAISFSFLPVIEMLAFAIVNAIGSRRSLPFARAVDRFFSGNWPWLLWLSTVAAVTATVPPRHVGPWLLFLVLSALVPFAASLFIDARFFREVSGRVPRAARTDVLIHRAIAWPLGIGYFFGIAIWSDQLPALLHWIGL